MTHEADVVFPDVEGDAGLFRRLGPRQLPLLARRVRPVAEIDAVPKLLMHEFAGVIDDADQAATFFGLKLLASFGKFALGLLQVARVG